MRFHVSWLELLCIAQTCWLAIMLLRACIRVIVKKLELVINKYYLESMGLQVIIQTQEGVYFYFYKGFKHMLAIRKQVQKCVQNVSSFRLGSKISNSCGCNRVEEGLHVMFKIEKESSQSGDNGRNFFIMIDNNAQPSCQHQQFQVSKPPTLVIVSPRNQRCDDTCPWF